MEHYLSSHAQIILGELGVTCLENLQCLGMLKPAKVTGTLIKKLVGFESRTSQFYSTLINPLGHSPQNLCLLSNSEIYLK